MLNYEPFHAPSTSKECLDYLDIHLGFLVASWSKLSLEVLQQMTIKINARETSGGEWGFGGGEGCVDFGWSKSE